MALGILEGLERRHLHIVRAFGVIGTRAAMTDVGAGCSKEPVCGFDALRQRQGRDLGLSCVLRRQTLALLHVEHSVTLHEGD